MLSFEPEAEVEEEERVEDDGQDGMNRMWSSPREKLNRKIIYECESDSEERSSHDSGSGRSSKKNTFKYELLDEHGNPIVMKDISKLETKLGKKKNEFLLLSPENFQSALTATADGVESPSEEFQLEHMLPSPTDVGFLQSPTNQIGGQFIKTPRNNFNKLPRSTSSPNYVPLSSRTKTLSCDDIYNESGTNSHLIFRQTQSEIALKSPELNSPSSSNNNNNNNNSDNISNTRPKLRVVIREGNDVNPFARRVSSFRSKQRRNTDSVLPRLPSPPSSCSAPRLSTPGEEEGPHFFSSNPNTLKSNHVNTNPPQTTRPMRRRFSTTEVPLCEDEENQPNQFNEISTTSSSQIFGRRKLRRSPNRNTFIPPSSPGEEPHLLSKEICGIKPLTRFARRNSSSCGEASFDAKLLGKMGYMKPLDENVTIQLGQQIGRGSFGAVYMGMNLSNGCQYAVKRLQKNVDEKSSKAHQEEIKVMEELRHENIVQYLGSKYDDKQGHLDIYMEYVPGGSVATFVKTYGKLGDQLVSKFTRHMIKGIAYLHSKNIIHRDIKGGNVLITIDGVAKLADFGCSKSLNEMDTADREETLCKIRGSIPWMAPEMVRETQYHFPADIWSLGATALEMSSGKRPWPDITEQFAAIFRIGNATGPPPIPDTISDVIRDFLLQCFKINPQERKTALQLLSHDLFV